jgi:hypothetical protein
MRALPALLLVVAALGCFIGQGVRLARHYSPTFDEAAYLVAGYSYWRTGDFRIQPDHPPLAKLLFALPLVLSEPDLRPLDGGLLDHGNHWEVSRWFMANSPAPIERLFFKARLVNLALGAFLLIVIAWWSYRLAGQGAAVFSVWLAALDPSLQAHSCLLTMDIGLTLFATLTFYALWEFLRAPSQPRLIGIGLALGLTLATKFTGIFVGLMLVGIVALHLIAGGLFCMPGTAPVSAQPSLRERGRLALAPLVRLSLIAGLVLVAVCFVHGFPVWGQGFKEQLVRAGRVNITYLNGEITPHGVWFYYPVVFAFKTPIGSLLAFVAGLLLALGAPTRWSDLRLLVLPALGYFAFMMYSGVDLGVRLILPVFPFLYVLAGRLAAIPAKVNLRSGIAWLAAGALLIGNAVSVWCIAPDQLAYFNQLAGGPADGYRHLADSNLDWGQDLYVLKREMLDRHVPVFYLSYYGTMEPEWFGICCQSLPSYGRITTPPNERVPGDAPVKLLAVSVNNLLGLYLDDPSRYRWLLERPPAFRAGFSIHAYDLTDDPEGLQRVEAMSK